MHRPDSPIPELAEALRKSLDGEVRTDLTSRLLYSTDASIYQVEPLGVVLPRSQEDLAAAVEIAARFKVPVLARGAGSSLAGQAVGPALILDCSRYLTRLIDIDPEARTATFEPGLVLTNLNKAAARYGLRFGPDPASADRATMGGTLANNATGAHSIQYGMAADHLLAAETVLSDGSLAGFYEVDLDEARRRADQAGRGNGSPGIEAGFYAAALRIREQYSEAIQAGWPQTWRRASGYNLNYLLPWAPSHPPQWSDSSHVWMSAAPASGGSLPYPPVNNGRINLAPLLAGSEGTLAVIRQATVRLVPVPRHTVLAVLGYDSVPEACDDAPGLLSRGPSAIELIPRSIIQLARLVPAYTHLLSFVDLVPGSKNPAALLAVEFSGDDPAALLEQARALGPRAYIAESKQAQEQVWAVRNVGLGILSSRFGDVKSIAAIEDLAVPVDRLGEFVREMDRLLKNFGTTADFYAHASAGCLHIRPLLNIKTVDGVKTLRAFAEEAVGLAIRLGGSVSGEHGDGLARSEWLERLFGPEVSRALRELKTAADPHGLLNPGKIVDPEPMDRNLRFGPQYRAAAWDSILDFTRETGLDGAIEQCNGAGVCRKDGGVMCPSFQVTREEMHSTRGRANLLRAMISGHFPTQPMAERAVYEALDLCLACKGCKAECPSAVDVAKLKYTFTDYYYRHNRRNPRDYLFAYIEPLARFGRWLAPLANFVLQSRLAGVLGERIFGLARKRRLPVVQERALHELHARTRGARGVKGSETVLLLSDAFTEYFHPEVGMAAVRVLEAAGCRVEILPVIGAGRTLISKGFLEPARRHARKLLEAIEKIDPERRMAVVGLEPSEIYSLRDEYLDLLPGDERAKKLAERSYMVDEFLLRPGVEGEARIERIVNGNSKVRQGEKPARQVLLHGHCYQKARPPAADGFPTGVDASVQFLKACGFSVEVIDAGCCGMAGAFGYEAEHYDVSMQVGELALLPAVRAAGPEVIISASGVSCQEQIADGAKRRAAHPVVLVDEYLVHQSGSA